MGRVTDKTELAMFLVMVVKEMEVGTVDMWSSSLTIEDRLTALRLNQCCLFFFNFPLSRDTERGQLVCEVYKRFEKKNMEVDLFTLMVG